jgi:opacity protein-like surface antigen
MKRLWLCAFTMLLSAGAASAATIGVGAFGGASIPVVQDDNGQGTVYGVRLPISLVPLLTVEPYYASTQGGDKEQDLDGLTLERSGIDVTSYGANLLLTFGTGLQLYPFAGIGSAKSERPGLDASTTAYNFGLGLGFTPPAVPLAIHLRGELAAVMEDDDDESARKWANVTLGVTYNLFKFPPVP